MDMVANKFKCFNDYNTNRCRVPNLIIEASKKFKKVFNIPGFLEKNYSFVKKLGQ